MISRIAIKNFRSLKDVELRPGPLTVLIGPNGAGKSNILDALKFLKSIYSDYSDLTQAEDLARSQLEERGGFRQVVWGGHTDSHLRFEIEFDNTLESDIFSAEVTVDEERPYLSKEDYLIDSKPLGNLGDRLQVSFDIPIFAMQALDELKLWRFYDFAPKSMREPVRIRQEHTLNESGSNLSSVVHTLFSEGHPDLEEAVGMLQVMVPTVERLVSPIFGDGQTYVALKEKGVENPVGAWGLSDGTLLALALSVALTVRPRPKLICLETPEAEIHPLMMEGVADMLNSASQDTQIIVTTQSTRLLDQLPYERFVIVEKKRGKTRLRPLTVEEEDHDFFRMVGVGNAWYSGSIGGVP